MRAKRPNIRIKTGTDGRFYPWVDDKIWAVFATYEEALDGLKTTVEILGDKPPADTLKLTRRNAAAVAKYASLVGLTPAAFLKHYLTDFWDDDNDDGNAEQYLGNFT
jgi:hypothetical protein